MQPVVPTPGELARLAGLGAGLLPVEAYQVPGPRLVFRTGGMAQELAIAAALALVVLALGEFLLLRWKARRGPGAATSSL